MYRKRVRERDSYLPLSLSLHRYITRLYTYKLHGPASQPCQVLGPTHMQGMFMCLFGSNTILTKWSSIASMDIGGGLCRLHAGDVGFSF